MAQERSLIGFAVRKISQKFQYLTSNANRAKDIFCAFCSFHHSEHVPCKKVREKREWESGLIQWMK